MTKEEIDNIDVIVFEENAVVMSAEDYTKLWAYVHQLQQENENQKKILEVLKPLFKFDMGFNSRGIKGNYKYINCSSIIFEKYNKEQYELLKEWLEND